MANRPNLLCELEKGKLVDTQAGFVDTFNFAVAAIDNLEGGKNCTVDWTLPDHPVINVELPESETGGGGGIGVYDVVDDQGDGSRLRIEYNDEREDTYIDLSAGGGGGRVDDVSFVQRSAPNQYDRLSVLYTDGTSKTLYLPIDNAVSGITRVPSYYGDVLSVTYTRSSGSRQIPLHITLSGSHNSNTIQDTAFRFTSAADSNVKVAVRGSNQIEIGVYYL